MVGTPQRRHSSRHRRTAAILALRAIQNTSPIRPSERRAERRRQHRDRTRRREAAFYRGLLAFCGAPPAQPQRRRRAAPPPPVVDQVIQVPSDTSEEEVEVQVQAQPIIVELDSSLDTLPDIDPRPVLEPQAEPLQDLGHLNITLEFPPPLQHQALREAFVLLNRLQLPPLQPLTPPPEFPPRPPTPPEEEVVDWQDLEEAVAAFDGQHHFAPPPMLVPQQPNIVPQPEFVPVGFAQPPPLPQVDWAMVAYALFTLAERESRQQINNPNQIV